VYEGKGTGEGSSFGKIYGILRPAAKRSHGRHSKKESHREPVIVTQKGKIAYICAVLDANGDSGGTVGGVTFKAEGGLRTTEVTRLSRSRL